MKNRNTYQQLVRGLSAGLLLIAALGLAIAQGAKPVAAPAQPVAGTTLVDNLQLVSGEIRTLPKIPRVGAWSLVLGRPETSTEGVGIQIDTKGQAVIYPTITLLSGPVGTIDFSVLVTTAIDTADAQPRYLLDSWPMDGPAHIWLTLTGTKLSLGLTDNANQTKTVEGQVNWGVKSFHKLTIYWDATDLSMNVDGVFFGKADKAGLPTREPLGICLGNSRDFQNPAKMAVSNLRLSTAREPNPASALQSPDDNVPNDELTLKMAQGYDRRLYPLLERLRQQNVGEVNFAYASAYADIGDVDRAMQAVTPIARDINNPLFVQAVFLRVSLLAMQRDYNSAYEQLQVLTASKETATSVRAQVKQAQMLYEQGNKGEAMRLIGEVIARYPDLKDINDAYLLIGLDKFHSGDFQGAFRAFDNIGIPGAPPRQSVAIGVPFELKVADPDMSVRLSDVGLPVTVKSSGGDTKKVTLKPAFSRGVYLGSVDTVLGGPKADDGALYVRGNDKLKVSYTDRQGVEHTVGMDLATDAKLIILAQSALNIYKEVLEYQKRNILDDNWELVGKLPKNASSFFRDPQDGSLRRKGTRFDPGVISNIKAGQAIYVELIDPDLDVTANPDTAEVQLNTQSGKKMTVTVTETGPDTGIFTAVVKTTPEGTPQAGLLEVSKNDAITCTYNDANPATGSRVSPIHVSRMAIRTTDGTIVCGTEGTLNTDDGPQKVFMRAYRVPNNTNVIVSVEDRDLDISDTPDKVTVKLHADSGSDLSLELTETGAHTGIFNGLAKITADAAATGANVLHVKLGDKVTATYADEENSTGRTVDRLYTFFANQPEKATMIFQRQIVERPKNVKELNLSLPPTNVSWQETTALVPGSVYRVILTDGDLVPPGPYEFYTKIVLKSANGASVEVPVRYGVDQRTLTSSFIGDFFVRLGDPGSPTKAYFSQTGSVIEVKDEEAANNIWSLPAINVQGKDKVTATYIDPSAPDGTNVPRTVSLRIGMDATLATLNMQGNPITELKPGMPFELQVEDATGDLTAKRDTLEATVSSSTGDKLDVELSETDVHSGIFSAIVKTVSDTAAAATAGALKVPFGGKVMVSYHNENTQAGTPADRTMQLATRPLADADAALLTKVFDDPKFEVETLVRLGESLYAVGAAELAGIKAEPGKPRTNAKLQESARLLQLLAARFPASEYVVESLYLTGKIRREELKTAEAEKLFTRVIDEYPDSEFVPQALYQLVLLYYDRDDISKATESAMRLVYGFPKNALVADAVLRIAEYYYNKKKEYLTAAFIYKRLVERFPDNPKIDLITYRMATAYYRAGLAGEPTALASAIRYYMEFTETYKDHELADDALYWAANAFMKQNNVRRAYTLLTKQLITYPKGDMYAYAQRMRDKIKEDNPSIQADEF